MNLLLKNLIQNLKSYYVDFFKCDMDKQYAFAVILIILGVGLSQSGSSDTFSTGLGIGIIVMGSFWVLIRLIKEIKRK